MSKIQIAVINESTVCTDATLALCCRAVQQQVTRDFAAAWDLDATLLFVRQGKTPPAGAWPCYVLNVADQPGALGYHDEDGNAKPFGRVFAQTTAAAGEKLSVTLSHEILEMLADPYVRLAVFVQASGRLYAYETADATEAGSYLVGGVPVSDFVYPAWFDPAAVRPGTRYNYLASLKAPFELAPGGYISVYDTSSGQWSQVQADMAHVCAHHLPLTRMARPGSRLERRWETAKRQRPGGQEG